MLAFTSTAPTAGDLPLLHSCRRSPETVRVLVGCERSGIVRDAFAALDFDVWSCDLAPSDRPSNRHIQGDIRDVLASDRWDVLAVMHPPCTRLCNSGVRWVSPTGAPPPGRTREEMDAELTAGCRLFSDCWNADIPHICVENPVMHRYAKQRIRNFRPHAQSVQPWQFGTSRHGEDNVRKRTCFWLRALPTLRPTGTLDGSTARADVHNASPGPDRSERRSRFFPGLARAMAAQWGAYVCAVA